jgi:hypothetical protein
MPRPVKPEFTRDGDFLKDIGNGWIDWESLLDKAEEDLNQCND